MIRKQAITEHSVKGNPPTLPPSHLQKEKEKIKQTNKQNTGKVKKKKCKWIINN